MLIIICQKSTDKNVMTIGMHLSKMCWWETSMVDFECDFWIAVNTAKLSGYSFETEVVEGAVA